MKRNLLAELKSWKGRAHRKPLIIRGARQVGKTWVMKEFGRQEFRQTVYVNFDSTRSLDLLFSGDLDIASILKGLEVYSGVRIDPADTLLIFDEIQEQPRALSALKYFAEEAPQYAVVCAGSLLGVAMHQGTNFPVGKVEFLDLYPMSFLEFLDATGDSASADLIRQANWPLLTTFKERLIDRLRHYYLVGGMPEAVATYLENPLSEVRKVQQRILEAYEQDFSKHAPPETVARIRLVWHSIPIQLAKENRRFVYKMLRKGARAKDFELALQWLHDSGLIYQVQRISKPAIPLPVYGDEGFKIFLLDTGLLGAMSGLDIKSILEGNLLFSEFKGALTKQYVQQQLRAECGIQPAYWSTERSDAEVDFVFQHDKYIFPLEVKAEENLKAKSLRVYFDKFAPPVAIRTSMSDYRKEAWLLNIPLYAIATLPNALE